MRSMDREDRIGRVHPSQLFAAPPNESRRGIVQRVDRWEFRFERQETFCSNPSNRANS